MKKKLYLLAIFMAMNVAASANFNCSSLFYFSTGLHKNLPSKTAISVEIDAKNELLKVKAVEPIIELSINDLYGRRLLHRKQANTIKLAVLPRGVYELEVKVTDRTYRKRIILHLNILGSKLVR